MNKRKPDDEFANIHLSYFTADGKEIVVYCPESRHAVATQNPMRQELDDKPRDKGPHAAREKLASKQLAQTEMPPPIQAEAQDAEPELQEQHFAILYGDTGYSYESIVGPYLRGAKELTVEDPYIRLPHQIQNFVRFCETIVKAPTIKKIHLLTGYDDTSHSLNQLPIF
jgi:ATP-dependent Lon protease